jgi:Zn-dependent protease
MNISASKLKTSFILTLKSAKLWSIFKLLKFSKPLLTAFSLSVSALTYGWAYGPLFGVALVGVLMVHEMGHIMALRQRGFNVPGPVFIPFLGAAIFIPKVDCRETEAWIGIGGPVIGMSVAVLCFLLYEITGWGVLLPITFLGVMLNVFNLIPISPMDGGRILQVLGHWPKYIGGTFLIGLTFYLRDPGLVMIWILCLDAFALPQYATPKVGVGLWVSMATLFAMGYGNEGHWHMVFDLSLAVLFCLVLWNRDYRIYKTPEEFAKNVLARDERPFPKAFIMQGYTAAYLALCGVGALLLTAVHLPK